MSKKTVFPAKAVGNKIYSHLAQITSADLGIEDHGIFTIMMGADLETGGSFGSVSCLCFGSYEWEKGMEGPDYLRSYLAGLFKAVGVETLSQLKGKYVYLLSEKEHLHDASDIVGFRGMKKSGNNVFDVAKWKQFVRSYDKAS